MSTVAEKLTGFAQSTGVRCPKCKGGMIEWLVTPGQPMPNPVDCSCECGHRWQQAFAKEPNKNRWHRVTVEDQGRIRCQPCANKGVDHAAELCEHAEWNTGNTKGMSFWYYCVPVAIEKGFRPELVI
jgi:hypothetical protein